MQATVVKSTGSWYQVKTDDKQVLDCRIKGKFRIQGIKSTNPVAVGDRVTVIQEGENGLITEIHPRKNYIIRRSINLSRQTHILAANLDQAVLVVTLKNPRTSTGFIDRFLLTAEAYAIPVVLVFNKVDLYNASDLELLDYYTQVYQQMDYTVLAVSAFDPNQVRLVKDILTDKTSLIAGHSGVGKSTLVNAIAPELNLRTGAISEAHAKGTHTTTFAEMFELPFGGSIIDTPGIKELGIVHMEKYELSHYFRDMRSFLAGCQFNNCLHHNEPKCAVKQAVEEGEIAEHRYLNYLSVLLGDELKQAYEE